MFCSSNAVCAGLSISKRCSPTLYSSHNIEIRRCSRFPTKCLRHQRCSTKINEAWLAIEVRHKCGAVQISSSAPDRAQLAVMAILATVGPVRDLFLRTNQATGLGKKMQMTTGKRRNSQMWSSTDVGGQVLRLTNAMDPRH